MTVLKHHRLLTSVGLGQVTLAAFLWAPSHTAPEDDHHHVIAAALRPLAVGGGL